MSAPTKTAVGSLCGSCSRGTMEPFIAGSLRCTNCHLGVLAADVESVGAGRDAADRADVVDVANYAAFLWHHLNRPTAEIPMQIETSVGSDMTRTPLAQMQAARYQKFATIRAVRVVGPFTVESKEGTLRGEPGDYLAIADDDTPEQPHRWIISGADFERTYREVPADG